MSTEIDDADIDFEEQQAKQSEQDMALDERDAEEKSAENEMHSSVGAASGDADNFWGAQGDPWSQGRSRS
eukprot:2775641-Karenia_brevis.AAC.1